MLRKKAFRWTEINLRHFSAGAAANWRGRRRFYEHTGVYDEEIDGKKLFGVTLNGKQLSSPNRNKLLVPSELLATSLAHEWDIQQDKIRPTTMPLVVLTCSAIDVTPFSREAIIEELMRYLITDTLCYFQESSKILERQHQIWSPMIESFSESFGEVDKSYHMGVPSHPTSTVENLRSFLFSLDDYSLTALESLTSGLKSIIASSLILKRVKQADEADVAGEAITAARLEEEAQIEEWGLVEGGHDIDRANTNVQIYGATYFLRCLANEELL